MSRLAYARRRAHMAESTRFLPFIFCIMNMGVFEFFYFFLNHMHMYVLNEK